MFLYNFDEFLLPLFNVIIKVFLVWVFNIFLIFYYEILAMIFKLSVF